ncbi:hypothetical protein ACIBCH_20845 [Amycolatopsis thailandensis]|uniref:hypothetical protein n=1 Tax=Amycolatopsis thailandensis TaxID=589330 RepID=UPI00379E518A
MTTVHTLLHVVEHAERWRIGDHPIKQFAANPVRVSFLLPDQHTDLFVKWARHLDDERITGFAAGPIGHLHVRGRILSGHTIEVSVLHEGQFLRTTGLVGALTLGEVEQAARKAVAA